METIYTDVLIIGAGAAGIRAAASAAENGASVLVLAEHKLSRGGATFSPLAKGWGIQALVGEERTDQNLDKFYSDILVAGLGACDPGLVRELVQASGDCVEDLMARGLRFKKTNTGDYFRATGCFSTEKRAFITEDFSNIQQTLSSMLRHENVRIMTGTAIDLIVQAGECGGAFILDDYRADDAPIQAE